MIAFGSILKVNWRHIQVDNYTYAFLNQTWNTICNFKSGNEGNDQSTSSDLDSVYPSRKLFRWDKSPDGTSYIPYEISKQFRFQFYDDINKTIDDVNSNLKDCVKFRYEPP